MTADFNLEGPAMRHTLEQKTVRQIVAAKRGQFSLIRARYVKAMQRIGYTAEQALSCFADVWDVAELERAYGSP